MEKRILYLFTRTPLHVGAGNSVGVVDSPIQRERHTRIPIIPGSSLKGVLAEMFPSSYRDIGGKQTLRRDDESLWLFGNDSGESETKKHKSGALLIGESKVLAFPVRSMKGGFAWITCPLVIARYKRDIKGDLEPPVTLNEEHNCLITLKNQVADKDQVVLEEYVFKVQGTIDEKIIEAFNEICTDPVWSSIADRLVVVPDEIFSYFVENACEIITRIRIDSESGTAAEGAMFNQEQVPSETMFYTIIAAQEEKGKEIENRRSASDALDELADSFNDIDVIQVGGDETIGLGYCSVYLSNGRNL